MADTCDCGGAVKWRTSKRQGRVCVRYGSCSCCGQRVKRLVPFDEVRTRKRRRVTTVCASKVVSGPDSRIDSGDERVLPVEDFNHTEHDMDKRTKVLRQIDNLRNNPRITELRDEITDLRKFISSHELRVAERKAAEAAQELERLEWRVARSLPALEGELKAAEPDSLRDIRRSVELALYQHQLTDVPAGRQQYPETVAVMRRHMERGAALTQAAERLRRCWQCADWRTELQSIIDEHKSQVTELRNLTIEETEDVEA